jgi:chromosome segregation ATPase
MEFEQIISRLQWLDEEHRKDKSSLDELGKQISSLETTLNAVSSQLKTLAKQVSEISPAVARLGQFDEMLSKQRADTSKALDEYEKRAQRRDSETAKLNQARLDEIHKSLADLNVSFNPDALKQQAKERAAEEKRLNQVILEIRQKLEEALKTNAEVVRAHKTIDDARRQDLKRMTDLQGEIASVRKRADEAREKAILHGDGIRNLENRVGELFAAETERKDTQETFLAQQALGQVERDRAWKDWREKYDAFQKQSEAMETQVLTFDETLRTAKRAQETYTDLNQKLERRISEVTEMQRLAEDRMRQEWVTFKADEQKRWTGHSLSQEEAMRDLRKDMDKLEQRVGLLDDAAQVMQDQLAQTSDTTEQQLQELMNVAHDWLTAYERIMGHAKAKKTTR